MEPQGFDEENEILTIANPQISGRERKSSLDVTQMTDHAKKISSLSKDLDHLGNNAKSNLVEIGDKTSQDLSSEHLEVPSHVYALP